MSIITPSGHFRGAEIVDARREHLEPQELEALFDVLKPDPFWYGYFSTQYYYGCRMSEVSIILMEDVSFKTSEIVIRRLKKRQYEMTIERTKDEAGKTVIKRHVDKSKPPGPGFREQVYGMPAKLAEVLGNVPHHDRHNPWFFGSSKRPRKKAPVERMGVIRRTGGYAAVARSTVDDRFKEACKRAKIPRHLSHTHVLRHTRATLMLANGAREEDVQFLLDHSSINTTRRYLGIAKALRLRLQTSAQLGLADFLGD